MRTKGMIGKIWLHGRKGKPFRCANPKGRNRQGDMTMLTPSKNEETIRPLQTLGQKEKRSLKRRENAEK